MARQRDLLEILNDHENSLRRIQATLARVAAASVAALDDLTDVTITGGATRHVLAHNGAGQYVNRLLVEADISDLGSYLPLSGGTMTGAILSPAGSAAAPAYQVGVADMGLFYEGAGLFGFALDGATALLLREGRLTLYDQGAATADAAQTYIDFYDNAGHRLGILGNTLATDDDFSVYADTGDLKLYPGGGTVYTYDTGQSAYVETFPKGTLIVMDAYADTVDYTSVPASSTITHSLVVACEYANQPVYVEVSILVRWADLTVGNYVWSRPYINGSGYTTINVDTADTTLHLTQTTTTRKQVTADSSGDVTLQVNAYSQGGTADITEVTITYAIWRA
jgi:hypothetical protein